MATEARVKITAHDRTGRAIRSVKSGLRSIGGAALSVTKRMKGVVGVLGLLGVGLSLSQIGREVVVFGDRIDKLSKRLEVPAVELSGMAFAAELAGIEFKQFAKISQDMLASVSEAESGLVRTQDAFDALRVDAAAFGRLNFTEQMGVMAEAFSEIKDNELRLFTAESLFGGRGTSALQMFVDGAEGIALALEDAARSGAIITQEQATQAANLVDEVARYNAGLRAAGVSALGISEFLVGGTETSVGNVDEMAEKLRAIREGLSTIVVGKKAEEEAENVVEAVENAKERVSGSIADAIATGADDGSKSMAETIVNTVRRNVVKQIADLITAALAGVGGGSGGFIQGVASLFGFQTGGVVPGPRGQPQLAVVHGQERVLTTHQQNTGVGGGITINQNITVGDIATKSDVIAAMTLVNQQAQFEMLQKLERGSV